MQDEIENQIRRVQGQEPGSHDALFAAAYPELRRLARCRLQESGRRLPMETVELVNESYLRLQGLSLPRCEHRRAFFACVNFAMRSVIVDKLRAGQTRRRGGDLEFVPMDTVIADSVSAEEEADSDLLEALEMLAEVEPRLATVVEMRYFGGFSEVEIACHLGVTDRTVRRDWDKARLLLSRMIEH